MTTDTLVSFLLTYAVHSTLLLAAAWLACRARLVRSPQTEDALFKAAACGGVLLAALHVTIGLPTLARPRAAPDATPVVTATLSAPAPARRENEAPRAEGPPARAAADVRPAAAPRREAPLAAWAPSPEPTGSARWAGPSAGVLAGGAWLAIAAALVARQLARRRRWLARLGERRAVPDGWLATTFARLCARGDVAGAALTATRAPELTSPVAIDGREVCLPRRAVEALPRAQQAPMLAHEIAHLVRRDPAWLRLLLLIESVFFFQPLNRMARRRVQAVSELLCDDWAVRSTRGRLHLARCLAEVAAWRRAAAAPAPAAGMADGDPSSLLRRVERLVAERTGEPRPAAWRGALVALLLVAAVACGVPGLGGAPARAGVLGPLAPLLAWLEPPAATPHDDEAEVTDETPVVTIEVRDGRVVARVDGRVVTAERMEIRDGRIVVLDGRGDDRLVIRLRPDEGGAGREGAPVTPPAPPHASASPHPPHPAAARPAPAHGHPPGALAAADFTSPAALPPHHGDEEGRSPDRDAERTVEELERELEAIEREHERAIEDAERDHELRLEARLHEHESERLELERKIEDEERAFEREWEQGVHAIEREWEELEAVLERQVESLDHEIEHVREEIEAEAEHELALLEDELARGRARLEDEWRERQRHFVEEHEAGERDEHELERALHAAEREHHRAAEQLEREVERSMLRLERELEARARTLEAERDAQRRQLERRLLDEQRAFELARRELERALEHERLQTIRAHEDRLRERERELQLVERELEEELRARVEAAERSWLEQRRAYQGALREHERARGRLDGCDDCGETRACSGCGDCEGDPEEGCGRCAEDEEAPAAEPDPRLVLATPGRR